MRDYQAEHFKALNNLLIACHVVRHAEIKAKRGKSPSKTYKGERNPLKALKLAKAELPMLYYVYTKTKIECFFNPDRD